MRKGCAEEKECTACQEDEEQEQNQRVLLVEEVIGQACQVGVDAATSVACIEASEGIGNVDAQKSVTEADGSFA